MIAEQIKDKEFLEGKIKTIKKINPSADVQLLEKTIGALHLVELLIKNDIDFVFKGGTSLVILLDDIKRFSVDVDIITLESIDKLENAFNNIINTSDLFVRLEENERDNAVSKRMQIRHYKFFFNSVTDQSEKYILLDVAFESNEYPKTIKKKVSCTKLGIDSDVEVNIPTIESILGDKLTVLATNTTGIKYNSGKELELIKQLYDVGNLFDKATNINEVTTSFINIANRELQYRKLLELSYEDVLNDIQEFCEDIIFQENIEHLNILASGIRKFSNYMLDKKFKRDIEAVTTSSKVLYLISCIRNNKEIEKYDVNNSSLNEELNFENYDKARKKRLKILKKINSEAYYYFINSL